MLTNSIKSKALELGSTLLHRGWSFSCAESCTGGGLAFAATSVAGSSEWFQRSFVTYSNQAKMDLLSVESKTLESFGAVSEQTVRQMAQGCAKASGAQVSVSVSGIAGPGGGSENKPVGLVWFGFSIAGDVTSSQHVFQGDREQVRLQAIDYALTKVCSLLSN